MKKVKVLAKTGRRSSGKTTLGILLSQLANSPAVFHIDTSRMIQWVMDRHGPLGRDLVKLKPSMDNGFYAPDDLVIPAAEMWLKCFLPDHPSVKQLIWTGWCRTHEQTRFLAQFEDFAVTHTIMSEEDCVKSTLRRNEIESPRADATRTALETHLREYREKTLPAMEAEEFWGKITTLDRNDDLTHRLRQCVPLVYAPAHICHRIRRGLDDSNHWIHEQIARIEGGNQTGTRGQAVPQLAVVA